MKDCVEENPMNEYICDSAERLGYVRTAWLKKEKSREATDI